MNASRSLLRFRWPRSCAAWAFCMNATEFYIDRARCALTIAQQYTQLRGRAHQSTPKTDYAARVLPSPRAAPGD